MKTAFVTGHRYITINRPNLDGINRLIDYSIEQGVTEYLIGMARGADLLTAEILISRGLNWTAVIPCRDQTIKWSKSEQQRYERILAHAKGSIAQRHSVIVLYEKYSQGVMQSRNQWMVNKSQLCLAVYDGALTGGTALTVNMAIDRHLPIIQFNPKTRRFKLIQSSQLNLF